MPARDQLFLLPPLFADPKAGAGRFHCPECAQVEGVLSYFPFLRDRLEVNYVDFPRPRPDVIALVGAENQGCPILVLGGTAPVRVTVRHHAPTGRNFVSGYAEIAAYLAAVHGTSDPHP
jgi:hypothetical protein